MNGLDICVQSVYGEHVSILGSLETDSSKKGRSFLGSGSEADDAK